jgi:hypothetical protein
MHNPIFNLTVGVTAMMVVKRVFRVVAKASGTSVMESVISFTLGKLNYMVEANYFPDWLIRIGIRALLVSRLESLPRVNVEVQQAMNSRFVEELK